MLTSGRNFSNKVIYLHCVANSCVTVLNIFSKEVIPNRQNQTSKTNFEVHIKQLIVQVNWWWNFTHPRVCTIYLNFEICFREITSEIGLGVISGKYLYI